MSNQTPEQPNQPDAITKFLNREVSRRKILQKTLQGAALLGALGLSSSVIAACGKGPGAEAIERHRDEFQVGGTPTIYRGILHINHEANRRFTPAIVEDPERPNFAYNLRDKNAVEVVVNPIIINDGQHANPQYGKKGKWIEFYSAVTKSMVFVYVGDETASTFITSPTDQSIKPYDSKLEQKCTVTRADLPNQQLFCNLDNQEMPIAQSSVVLPSNATSPK